MRGMMIDGTGYEDETAAGDNEWFNQTASDADRGTEYEHETNSLDGGCTSALGLEPSQWALYYLGYETKRLTVNGGKEGCDGSWSKPQHMSGRKRV